MNIKQVIIGGSIFCSAILWSSCKVSYSFSGIKIPEDINTASVQYFPNRPAPTSIADPSLSQEFMDALIDRIQSQTRLELMNGIGDVNFEGEIKGYTTRPVAITANERPANTRFTLSIRVKFTNYKDPAASFDQSFTAYEDYPTSEQLDNVKAEILPLIFDKILEDVMNKAFVNW